MENKATRFFDILGVKISAITIEDALSCVEGAVRERKRIYICTCPVGTIMAAQDNPEVLNSLNRACLVTPDGMPVVWIGRLKGYARIHRVYGPDLLLAACRISKERGFRHFFYGSQPQVLIKLKTRLQESFPDLVIAGSYSPSFRELCEQEEVEIIELINKSNSDILWVGLGSPKQDLWMSKHRKALDVPVMIGVGAAFDFIAGTKKQAPGWMQSVGLEWLFRLLTEPRRLWKRYILGNCLFLLKFIGGLKSER